MAKEMRAHHSYPIVYIGSAAGLASTLSAGYVLWLLRSGQLITTLIVQLPAWQTMDPLTIFDQFEAENAEDGKNESLEDIIERNRDNATNVSNNQEAFV